MFGLRAQTHSLQVSMMSWPMIGFEMSDWWLSWTDTSQASQLPLTCERDAPMRWVELSWVELSWCTDGPNKWLTVTVGLQDDCRVSCVTIKCWLPKCWTSWGWLSWDWLNWVNNNWCPTWGDWVGERKNGIAVLPCQCTLVRAAAPPSLVYWQNGGLKVAV